MRVLYQFIHHFLFSELVDCDTLDDGCSGGLMTNAYEAIISLGGLETESNYPYTEEDDTCTFKKSEVVVTISGGVNISQDESKMAKWLFKNGPISIGINADDMQVSDVELHVLVLILTLP